MENANERPERRAFMKGAAMVSVGIAAFALPANEADAKQARELGVNDMDYVMKMAESEAIRNLLAEYPRYFDRGLAEKWAGLFEPDGVFGEPHFYGEKTGYVSGREGLRAFAEFMHQMGTSLGIPSVYIHVNSNSFITITGPTSATAQTDVSLLRRLPDGNWSIGGGAEYHDVLNKTDRWRFQRRIVEYKPGVQGFPDGPAKEALKAYFKPGD